MFEDFLKKLDEFNELDGCEGKHYLIDKDGEIEFYQRSMPTYKDKETYYVCIKTVDKSSKYNNRIGTEDVISAGYDNDYNNKVIQRFLEFMDCAEWGKPFKIYK